MADINETSSEYGLTVKRYTTLQRSPHTLSKKVIGVDWNKESDHNYRAPLGFNMYPQKQGKYTFVLQ